jgi:hypothetical protein
VKEIQDIISKSKSKLIDSFENLINAYKEFLTVLDTEQLCNLMTITSSLLIFICLFHIFIINFGNEIIDYFELESKYPKLAKFIRIRKNLQKFNIFINYLIILLALIFIIYINCITFAK